VHPPAGSRWQVVRTNTFAMTTSAGAVHSVQKIDKTLRIVKVEDDLTSEEHVAYLLDRTETSVHGQTQTKPTPTEGKRYILTQTPTGPKVTHDDGSDASPEEAAAAVHDERFGKHDDALEKFLDGRTFTEDTPVDVPSDALADVSGPFAAGAMQLTFRGMKGARASFDVTLTMSGDSNGSHLSVSLVGHALFDPATAVTDELMMSGTFQVAGQKQGVGTASFQEATTELK
jgi:hypothetical protein